MINVNDLPEQMQAGVGPSLSQVGCILFLYDWHFNIDSYIVMKCKEEEHVPIDPKIDFSSAIQFPPDGPESEDNVSSFEASILRY